MHTLLWHLLVMTLFAYTFFKLDCEPHVSTSIHRKFVQSTISSFLGFASVHCLHESIFVKVSIHSLSEHLFELLSRTTLGTAYWKALARVWVLVSTNRQMSNNMLTPRSLNLATPIIRDIRNQSWIADFAVVAEQITGIKECTCGV